MSRQGVGCLVFLAVIFPGRNPNGATGVHGIIPVCAYGCLVMIWGEAVAGCGIFYLWDLILISWIFDSPWMKNRILI